MPNPEHHQRTLGQECPALRVSPQNPWSAPRRILGVPNARESQRIPRAQIPACRVGIFEVQMFEAVSSRVTFDWLHFVPDGLECAMRAEGAIFLSLPPSYPTEEQCSYTEVYGHTASKPALQGMRGLAGGTGARVLKPGRVCLQGLSVSGGGESEGSEPPNRRRVPERVSPSFLR